MSCGCKNSVNLLCCMLGVSAFALCFAKLVVPSGIYLNLKVIQISLIILFTAFVCCNSVIVKNKDIASIPFFVKVVEKGTKFSVLKALKKN